MEEKKMLERYKARVKAQNEAAKEKWDSISCRLPKGTKKRITDLGLSVNGYINELVLADLARLEASAAPAEAVAVVEPVAAPAVIGGAETATNTTVSACECEQKENKDADKEIQAGEQNRVNGTKSDRDLYEFFKDMTEDELMDAFFINKGNHEGKTSDEIGKARQTCLLHELAKARGVLPDHLK